MHHPQRSQSLSSKTVRRHRRQQKKAARPGTMVLVPKHLGGLLILLGVAVAVLAPRTCHSYVLLPKLGLSSTTRRSTNVSPVVSPSFLEMTKRRPDNDSVSTRQRPKRQRRTSSRKKVTNATTRRTSANSNIPLHQQQLWNHDLLTKSQEQELGRTIQKAQHLKKAIEELLEQKRQQYRKQQEQQQQCLEEEEEDLASLFDSSSSSSLQDDEIEQEDDDDEEDDYDLSHLSIYYQQDDDSDSDYDYDLTDAAAAAAQQRQQQSWFTQESRRLELHDQKSWVSSAVMTLNDNENIDETKQTDSLSSCFSKDDDFFLDLLSDSDIQKVLRGSGVVSSGGGRAKVESILLQGALARDALIRCNVRLVVSIAKRWCKQQQQQQQQQSSSSAPQVGSSASRSRRSAYQGGWDRPSLEEAVQEGILGLASAADRYDPERNLRFATYATWWVTNSVRTCFHKTSTGCLRLPVNFYETKTKYKTLAKKYYETEGKLPSIDVLANELGLEVPRLEMILRKTRPLLSTDMPLFPTSFSFAGKAGNDGGYNEDVSIADTLLDTEELQPEEQVELSFLRQCLENAMATELAPHERDILRLRLGLEDGVSRTVRQVVQEYGDRLTISEVRTAERRAFKKLRSPQSLSAYKLLDYLDSDLCGVDKETMTMR